VKALLLLVSLLLLPFTGSLILNLGLLFSRYRSMSPGMLFCAGGSIFCFLVFALFGPPARSYVFEHEISHVFFAFLTGVKVKRISVRKEGGSVETEKVNILIALAPYAFPLYAIIVFLLFSLLSLFAVSAALEHLFHLAFGFALGFHILATFHYIQVDQPDLKRYGYFSSLILILTLTVVVVVLMLGLVFAGAQIFDYFGSSWSQTFRFYEKVYRLFPKR